MAATSTAFTPAAGSILVVKLIANARYDGIGGSGLTVAMSDTFGTTGKGTWTKQATCTRAPVTTNGQYMEQVEIWTCPMGSAPGSGTVHFAVTADGGTITTTTDGFLWADVTEVNGQASSPIGATSGTTARQSAGPTTFVCTLGAAPAASSLVFSVIHADNSVVVSTLPTGFTGLNEVHPAWGVEARTAYINGGGSSTFTWTGLDTASNYMASGLEIKAASVFDPTQIAGCIGWWDPSDSLVTSGSNVTSITDKSGAGHTMVAFPDSGTITVGANQNGHSTLALGGNTTERLVYDGSTNIVAGPTLTAVIVFNRTADPQYIRALSAGVTTDSDWNRSGNMALFSKEADAGLGITFPSCSRNGVKSGFDLPINAWHVAMTVCNGSTIQVFVDGVPSTLNPTDSNGNFTVQDITIGNEPPSWGSPFTGQYGDVIVYNTALTSTDQTNLLNYLNAKWIAGHVGGPVALAGQSDGTSAASGLLNAAVAMAGSSAGVGSITTPTMAVARALAGRSDGVSTAAAGTLAGGVVQLAGRSDGTSGASGAMNVAYALAGQSDGVGSATAPTTNVARGLAGTSAGVGGTTSALGTALALAGTSAGVGAASASRLDVQRALAGQSDGSSTGSATGMPVQRALGAQSDGTSTGLASGMPVARALAGRSDGTSQALGDMTQGAKFLSGTSGGVGGATGSLSVLRPLAGQSDGAGTASGNLVRALALAGRSDGSSTVTGAMYGTVQMAGRSDGTSTVSGILVRAVALAGASVGISTAQGGTLSIVTFAGGVFVFRNGTWEMQEVGAPPIEVWNGTRWETDTKIWDGNRWQALNP
jgi:hypothetical protein